MLADRGVIVVPDVICNAGGVTVSYFEWVQDMASFFWSEEEINAKMDRIMTDAIVHVCDKAAEKRVLCVPRPTSSPASAFCWRVKIAASIRANVRVIQIRNPGSPGFYLHVPACLSHKTHIALTYFIFVT